MSSLPFCLCDNRAPGSTHHGAVWAGHIRPLPRHHVKLLELVLRRPDEHGVQTGQRQIWQQIQVSGSQTFQASCWNQALTFQIIDLTLFFFFAEKQEVIVDPYMKRVRIENNRYFSWQKLNSSHQGMVLQHWRALRRLLTSERGAWAHRYNDVWILTLKLIYEETLNCQIYSAWRCFVKIK